MKQAMIAPADRERIPALDATRGILALVVVLCHVALAFGSGALALPGLAAVLIFFTMSGFVLARSYNGQPFAFVFRRFVRLWPLYGICLIAGHIRAMSRLPLPELIWWPGYFPFVDPPMWSLRYEAWATPLMPLFFRVFSARPLAGFFLASLVFLFGWVLFDLRLISAACIITGVSASRFVLRLPEQWPAIVRWLGKISFSLYLTHQIVIDEGVSLAGPWGSVVALPAVFGIAWAAWRFIEKPSIFLSRKIGSGTKNA